MPSMQPMASYSGAFLLIISRWLASAPAPKLHEGRLYVGLASLEEDESRSNNYVCCTFRGAVAALDSETGQQIWKTYTIPEEPKVIKKNSIGVNYMVPSGSGVWTSPIIDPKRKAMYFGTGNSFSEPSAALSTISTRILDCTAAASSRSICSPESKSGTRR